MRGIKTGGRKAGTPNKITADVRALAQQYAPDVLAALLGIAGDIEQHGSARVAACKEILDRGYGKSQEPSRMDFLANVPMHSLTDDQLRDVANGVPFLPSLTVTFIDPEEVAE
ncbi:MAG: hypothetical protein ACOYBQ_08805 [Fluviibacter sp.]